MRKRLILFLANRTLHLLKLNYVFLAVHIVMVLSQTMAVHVCSASTPFAWGYAWVGAGLSYAQDSQDTLVSKRHRGDSLFVR